MTGGFLRRTRQGLGLAAFLATVSIGFGSPRAEATTFPPMTIDQFTDLSTYIVEGTVQSVWTELDPDSGLVWTKAEVQVSKTWKGPDQPTTLVVSSAGGAFGAYETWVPAAAVFSKGEQVFLFLAERGGGRLTPVGSFQGKYMVRRAPGETREYVRTWETSRGEPYDGRFLPHPAPQYRVYLEDLRTQVEDHLVAGWDGKPVPGLPLDKLTEINAPERRLP